MTQAKHQLWQQLNDSGLVSDSMPDNGEIETPWYIGALMAFLGWLAAMFLLGFLGLGVFQVFESPVASLLVGGIMIGGAYFLLRKKQTAFFDYFSLAISLAGQVLVLWGLLETSSNADTAFFWIVMMIIQITLAVIMAGTVHRVFSAYFACIALMAILILSGAQHLATSIILLCLVWLWLNEFRYPRYMSKIRSMGYGLVIALINIKGSMLIPFSGGLWWGRGPQPDLWIQPWAGQLFSGVVFLYLVWRLVHHHLQPGSISHGKQPAVRTLAIALLAAALIAGASLEAPGIIIGISILLLGFHGGNRVLIGLGCVSLLFYVSAYYYLLDNTLLIKSVSMLALGLVLIVSRFCLGKLLPEENSNA